MGNFRELNVWKNSKAVAVDIYKLVRENGELSKDFRLRDQITSSAVSVPSNIAEGDELDTHKQAIKHFYIAKGSCAELITQLEIAKEINFIKDHDANKLIDRCQQISSMLLNLIKARSKFIKQNNNS